MVPTKGLIINSESVRGDVRLRLGRDGRAGRGRRRINAHARGATGAPRLIAHHHNPLISTQQYYRNASSRPLIFATIEAVRISRRYLYLD